MSAWHGIVVATTLPLRDDLSIDFDRYQEKVRWLAEHGADGIAPNGSLGEYHVLTDEERARVVTAAVEAAPEGFTVMPGTGAYGADEARRWAEQAREAGAHALLSLPPNAYRAGEREIIHHYGEIAKAGLPVVAYNNPFDTRVDLTPEILRELSEIPEVVAVKEYSGDIRRITSVKRVAPALDVLAGSDDTILEATLMGAVGWIGGFSNAIPSLPAWGRGQGRRGTRALPIPAAGVHVGYPAHLRASHQAGPGGRRAVRRAIACTATCPHCGGACQSNRRRGARPHRAAPRLIKSTRRPDRHSS